MWVIVISWLGVFLAVPAKRQMINIEQLPFPSGIAAATTLRALHTQGGEATRQARALGIAALVGAVITWLRDATERSLKPLWIQVGVLGHELDASIGNYQMPASSRWRSRARCCSSRPARSSASARRGA